MDERIQYWESNINKWNAYYEFSHSDEELNGPKVFRKFYRAYIVPVEAWLMKRRYKMTIDFIESNLEPGKSFNDLGCGAGMFTIAALEKGASVNAIDFAETSLKTTLETATRNGVSTRKLKTLKLDLRVDAPPFADVTIAMGVAPYIENVEEFLERVLSSTNVFCCNYVNQNQPVNWLRRVLPVLNVRKLNFHSPRKIAYVVSSKGFDLTSRVKLGTGFVDVYQRKSMK
jgi:ubiquinone/menaquinone biosynthesis C-methylase UbiE